MTTKPRTDLRNPIYNDDDAAREHLETVLWPHGPVCPRCGVMGERITKLEERAHKLGAKLTVPMVLFLLPAMFVILGASPFLHLIRSFKQI